MDAASLLAVMRRGGIRIPYIMRDEFLTDRSAGAINGTAAEPGPSTRTVVDAENKLTVSGGKLVCAGGKATPAWGDPGLWLSQISLAGGVTVLSSFTSTATAGNSAIGLDVSQAGANDDSAFFLNFNTIKILESPSTIDAGVTISAATTYRIALIHNTRGRFFAIKGGTYTDWTLVWVGNATRTGNYPSLITENHAFQAEYARVAALPSPFNTDYGIATQRLAGARTAGDTFVHEANCLIEWTANTIASTAAFRFRAQDTDNYWEIGWTGAGEMALNECVAGARANRAYLAGVNLANGDRVVVVANGPTINLYVNNVLKINYTSATNFQTATAGIVTDMGTGGAICDVVTWPRTLTGRAAAILNKASA